MEPVRHGRALGAAFAGGALVALCAGCGLFKPAVPEKAQGTAIVGDYSYPDSTLATMARAIETKGNNGGQDAYMGALADTTADAHMFQALFDPATAQRWLANNPILPVWQRDQERQFYGVFSASNGGSNYVWRWSDGLASDDRTSDTLQILYRKYEIFLKRDSTITDTIGTGYAQLRMVRSGTRWVLWRWIDTEAVPQVGDALSYGDLRLKYQ